MPAIVSKGKHMMYNHPHLKTMIGVFITWQRFPHVHHTPDEITEEVRRRIMSAT
jgi:hypothetical protein